MSSRFLCVRNSWWGRSSSQQSCDRNFEFICPIFQSVQARYFSSSHHWALSYIIELLCAGLFVKAIPFKLCLNMDNVKELSNEDSDARWQCQVQNDLILNLVISNLSRSVQHAYSSKSLLSAVPNKISRRSRSSCRLPKIWSFHVIFLQKTTKGGVKRRTSHEPNPMLMRENKGFFLFAFDSAHVKYRVWPGPKKCIRIYYARARCTAIVFLIKPFVWWLSRCCYLRGLFVYVSFCQGGNACKSACTVRMREIRMTQWAISKLTEISETANDLQNTLRGMTWAIRPVWTIKLVSLHALMVHLKWLRTKASELTVQKKHLPNLISYLILKGGGASAIVILWEKIPTRWSFVTLSTI